MVEGVLEHPGAKKEEIPGENHEEEKRKPEKEESTTKE